MGLEPGDKIADLNASWPLGTDPKSEGDDHLRLIKRVIKGEVYGQSNILGTVSEVSGVPTGGVIERGSNANGDFVRFADGTQICTFVVSGVDITKAAGSIFRSDPILHDYAKPFAATPIGGGSMAGTITGWVNGRAASATGWAAGAFSYQSRPSEDVALMAVGRWF